MSDCVRDYHSDVWTFGRRSRNECVARRSYVGFHSAQQFDMFGPSDVRARESACGAHSFVLPHLLFGSLIDFLGTMTTFLFYRTSCFSGAKIIFKNLLFGSPIHLLSFVWDDVGSCGSWMRSQCSTKSHWDVDVSVLDGTTFAFCDALRPAHVIVRACRIFFSQLHVVSNCSVWTR